jgi:general secretion pathway protein A
MYEKFFGLQRTPFSMVPDADCVHVTGQHADVISGAVFGILERRGFVVLTGEAGLGKTTALRVVADLLLSSNAQTSLISHPTLNASEFLELAMLNFGIPDISPSKAQRLKALEKYLLEADAAGKTCVLIIDEAHQLPPEALEEIRLLGNFEAGNHKLLQILLAGQNELNARLDLPQLWQLKQRVAFRLSLKRLERDGVEEYITFRWAKAGGAKQPFDAEALDGIALWSQGIPRVINAICDNSLMLALSDAVRTIGIKLIQEVCQDLHLETTALPPRPQSIAEAQAMPEMPCALLDKELNEDPALNQVGEQESHVTLAQEANAGEVSSEPESKVNGPVLVVKGATISPPPVSRTLVSQTGKKFKGHKSAAPAPKSPLAPSAPAPAAQPWAQGRPSLLKKWLGFLDGHKPAEAEKSADLVSVKHS